LKWEAELKIKQPSHHHHHENNAEKKRESFKFYLQLRETAANVVKPRTFLPAVIPYKA